MRRSRSLFLASFLRWLTSLGCFVAVSSNRCVSPGRCLDVPHRKVSRLIFRHAVSFMGEIVQRCTDDSLLGVLVLPALRDREVGLVRLFSEGGGVRRGLRVSELSRAGLVLRVPPEKCKDSAIQYTEDALHSAQPQRDYFVLTLPILTEAALSFRAQRSLFYRVVSLAITGENVVPCHGFKRL